MNTSLIVSNFRDVGATINILADRTVMRPGVLYRGGDLGLVRELSLINSPASIINLRQGIDPEFPDATVFHCPAPNSVDVYLASLGSNHKWLNGILNLVGSAEVEDPVYIHCAAGKDRTGVAVGAILACINIDRQLIQQDYELSAGPLHPELFSGTLDAFMDADFFRKVKSESVASRFLSVENG